MADDPAWLAELPERIGNCVGRWRIEVGWPLEGGSLGRVYGCAGPNGEDWVLKLSPPLANAGEEADALAHWRGNGAVKLVDWDEPSAALLLECVRPGTYLLAMDRSPHLLDDDLAIRAASGVLRKLGSVPPPAEAAFPAFRDRLRWWLDYTATYGEPDAVGTPMLPLLERTALALDASCERKTLCHGDFVAKNLLLAADGSYVAVDPIPHVGDRCSDIGQFTAYHSPVSTAITRARAIAQRVGLDADRAAQWSALWLVFQACETWREDSDDVEAWVVGDECQRLLARILT